MAPPRDYTKTAVSLVLNKAEKILDAIYISPKSNPLFLVPRPTRSKNYMEIHPPFLAILLTDKNKPTNKHTEAQT